MKRKNRPRNKFSELAIGQRFKFYRGRNRYILSEIRHGFMYIYHDQSGIESSFDAAIFPYLLDQRVTILQ